MSKKIYIFCSSILVLVLVILLGKIFLQKQTQTEMDLVIQKGEVSFKRNFDLNYYKNLYNNDDIVALIEIAGKKMLLVQTDNNSYYLNHLLDKSYNILGTPFLDYRTKIGDKKMIVYGHNSVNYETPLKVLEKYSDEKFYEENSIIKVITDKEVSYKIFSVSYFKNDFTYYDVNIKDFDRHVNYLKAHSLYDTNVSVDAFDNLILFQTCSNTEKDTFIVISGKQIKIKE